MSAVVISGDTSGAVTLDAPAVAGTTTYTLTDKSGVIAPIVSGTAVTASGTSVDFTGIPSWVKRITVMFNGVSTNGASIVQAQIGAGSFTTSGYNTSFSYFSTAVSTTQLSTGFGIHGGAQSAANARSGSLILTTLGSNIWVGTGLFKVDAASDTGSAVGSITLGGTLDRIRITTVNGTDTFDAGTINIMYE